MKRLCPLLISLALLLIPNICLAQGLPTITFGIGEATDPSEVSTALQILAVLTILSAAPSILLMTTAFTRIVIVLSFARQAIGTPQAPGNQVVVSLALFLTFFIMAPVFSEINEKAIAPYMQKQIGLEVALEQAVLPMREFMFSQVDENTLEMMVEISASGQPTSREDVGTMTLIPAFMLSEIKRAFQMGFLIFVPFLVVDMVVASVLMAMGMMMLPPVVISLPFKILLFVLVDGWSLLVGSLFQSFA